MSTADRTPSETGYFARAWAAWSRFWFTPADPTPLCLMRIVAGLLILYVHVAYTFDLHAFFGRDGWYGTAQALRERREWPNFVPQLAWGPQAPRFRMPMFPEQRAAVRAFIEAVTRSPADQARVVRLLNSLPDGPGGRAATLRWLHFLPVESAERRVYFERMMRAGKDENAANVELPDYLLTLKETDRAAFRADADVFLEVLPDEPRLRSPIMTLLITQSGRDWEVLRDFMVDVGREPDPDKRKYMLDYAEKWSCPPDEEEIWAKGHRTYSPFFHITHPRAIEVLHGLHLLAIVLFTVGFCTRVTSVLTWLSVLAYVQRNPIILFGQDTMMNLCLFYLMLAPCGATWSVDALIRRYREGRRALREGRRAAPADPQPLVSANFVTRLLQIHYCLMYMSAGLAKLKGDPWWEGTAVWFTMTNAEFSPLHLRPYYLMLSWLCQDSNRWLWQVYMAATGVFTLVLEIGFPFLVWTRLRPLMVLGSILLHLGIALNMGLIVFSLFMFTLLLGAWMPAAAVRRVFARPPARLPRFRVEYDGRSPRQLRAAALTQALDVWGQAELIDRSAAKGASAPPDERLRVEADGTSWTGYAAAKQVASLLGMTQPVAWVLRLPGIAQIGQARYPGAAAEPSASSRKSTTAVASRS